MLQDHDVNFNMIICTPQLQVENGNNVQSAHYVVHNIFYLAYYFLYNTVIFIQYM